jgi:hypothetical protein
MSGLTPADALPGNIATAESVSRMEIASGRAVVRVGRISVPRRYTGVEVLRG